MEKINTVSVTLRAQDDYILAYIKMPIGRRVIPYAVEEKMIVMLSRNWRLLDSFHVDINDSDNRCYRWGRK